MKEEDEALRPTLRADANDEDPHVMSALNDGIQRDAAGVGGTPTTDRELHLARKAVEGNAWRLVALRVAFNKFQTMPPPDEAYEWSPQQLCDWIMAQPTSGVMVDAPPCSYCGGVHGDLPHPAITKVDGPKKVADGVGASEPPKRPNDASLQGVARA